MKQKDFFSELLGNPVRARVLRLFCATPTGCFTTDDIAKRTQSKKVAVAREIKVLLGLGLIKKGTCSRGEPHPKKKGETQSKRVSGWVVAVGSEHFKTLSAFVRDTQPPTEDSVLGKLKGVGTLKLVVISGFFVHADENPSRVDLLIVGDVLKEKKIASILRTIEAEHGREISYALLSVSEFKYRVDIYDRLVRDVLDFPHQVLLDKLRLT